MASQEKPELVDVIRALRDLTQTVASILTDRAVEERWAQAVQGLLERLATGRGENYFPTLVTEISKVLLARGVLVAAYDGVSYSPICLALEGQISEPFEPKLDIALKTTGPSEVEWFDASHPLQSVSESTQRFFQMTSAEQWAVLPLKTAAGSRCGILAVGFKSNFSDRPIVERLLTHFADRTAHELLRSQGDTELHQSLERFREITENLGEVVWIASPDFTQILYMSPSYERIWGKSCQSVYEVPESFFDVIHPEDRERVASVMRGENPANEQFRIQRNHATQRWIWARSFPVRENDHEIQRVVGIAQDITDRKHMEEKLLSWQKIEATGRLAGGIAHDFNNILTIIAGHGQFLRDAAGLDADLKNHVDAILASAEQAASLTRQLLAFGRKQILDPKRVDVNGVIEEMRTMLQSVMGESIKFSTNLRPAVDLVKVDPGQLKQVVINLAINARDAMLEGGVLHLETDQITLSEAEAKELDPMKPGSYVKLVVRDTGHGMDRKTLARIFEPFFTTKELGKGTGLGLAMVYGTVKQSGAFIFAESSVGSGTTFTLFFPSLGGERQPSRKVDVKAGVSEGWETILVVEDNSGIRELIRQVLTDRGYRVLAAPHGPAAIEQVEGFKDEIDLLLTDVVMPELNGRDLFKELSAKRASLKVLYMSGYTEGFLFDPQLDKERNFLRKPFSPAALLSKVRELLDS